MDVTIIPTLSCNFFTLPDIGIVGMYFCNRSNNFDIFFTNICVYSLL